MFQLALNFDLEEVIQAVKSTPVVVAQDDDDAVEFSDNEVILVTYRVLEDALEILGRKGCETEKAEILRWIAAPDIQYFRGAMVHAVDIPFSFQFCCRTLGFRADLLQAEIEAQIKQFNFQQ